MSLFPDPSGAITQADDPSGELVPEPPVSESRYAPGDVIARRYRLASLIRRGGMGYVWVAHNLALEVDVAVKLIRHELASPHASKRLLTEARAVARLGHPSIVRVFDHGTTERGDAFLVMELLRGEALDTILARGTRLPAQRAVQLLLPVASALAAAHAQGIVHRDVKPDNLVITTNEAGGIVPKLLDFGVAKFREEGRAAVTTHEGTTLGSPAYMAPEQALGASDVDARADIWGLCVVLYQAVSGYRPFEGPTYRAMMDAILRSEPTSLVELGVGDEALWAIVSRGLAKDPAARWSNMREVGRALALWLLSRGVEADSAGTALRPHWLGRATPHALLISGLTESGTSARSTGERLGLDGTGLSTTVRRAASRRSGLLVLIGALCMIASVLAAVVFIVSRPEPAAPAVDAPLSPSPEEPAEPIDEETPMEESAEPAPSASAVAEAPAKPKAPAPPPRAVPRPRPAAPAGSLPLPPTPDF